MLDFFKRASRTHARSESSPHLRDALANSFFPASSAHQEYDGRHCRNSSLESSQGAPYSFHPHILTQPTFTHRPDFPEPRKPTPDLPPLYTGSDRLSTAASRDQQTQLRDFAVSLEQPLQGSPTKLEQITEPALTGDKIERVKKEHQSRVLSGWFNGASEPISFGIIPSPTKEKSDPLADMSTKPILTTPKPTQSTRFSLFGSKAIPANAPLSSTNRTDEFLDLDMNAALYPTGPADTFSPASFKNHMQHAENLLSRLQSAYKERTVALQDMMAEKETQAEELEGAETRSKHLKTQLDGLSAKLAEQDKAMMDLVDDLANEKRLRREEEDARKKSLKLIRPSGLHPLTPCSPEEGFKHQKQRDRTSSATETDCDSEDESCGESLFSRNHSSSARMSLSSVSTTSSPETSQPPDLCSTVTSKTSRLRQAQPTLIKCQPQCSSAGESLVWSCANCHGGSSSEAWAVVSVLKMENRGLKERVSHVEVALDGCLDVIDRLQ